MTTRSYTTLWDTTHPTAQMLLIANQRPIMPDKLRYFTNGEFECLLERG